MAENTTKDIWNDDDGERADDGEAPGETVGAPGGGDAATQE